MLINWGEINIVQCTSLFDSFVELRLHCSNNLHVIFFQSSENTMSLFHNSGKLHTYCDILQKFFQYIFFITVVLRDALLKKVRL